jgi:hypothetical protein
LERIHDKGDLHHRLPNGLWPDLILKTMETFSLTR